MILINSLSPFWGGGLMMFTPGSTDLVTPRSTTWGNTTECNTREKSRLLYYSYMWDTCEWTHMHSSAHRAVITRGSQGSCFITMWKKWMLIENSVRGVNCVLCTFFYGKFVNRSFVNIFSVANHPACSLHSSIKNWSLASPGWNANIAAKWLIKKKNL